jgi:hypothetical protein
MHRRAMVLAVGLVFAGCGAIGPRVPLLTYPDAVASCYAGGEQGVTGLLTSEPTYGTSFAGRPVMWPHGYTARQVGNDVEVLDVNGGVKARTGRTYHISFAPPPSTLNPANAFVAAANCGYPHDFVDCTAAPTNQYCKKP